MPSFIDPEPLSTHSSAFFISGKIVPARNTAWASVAFVSASSE